MMAKIKSIGILGLTAYEILVEVDVASGFPSFTIVGLPDAAVKEAKERIRTAIKNSGFKFPGTQRITINLAPAYLKKAGASFDLAMAVGILKATGQIESKSNKYPDAYYVGELALDGALRFTPAVISALLFLKSIKKIEQKDAPRVFLPLANFFEAEIVEKNLEGYFLFKDLKSTTEFLKSENYDFKKSSEFLSSFAVSPDKAAASRSFYVDFDDIQGQQIGKRALAVAVAGRHNVLFEGPPGAGKTMLANSICGILPDPTPSERLETAHIYSVAGLADATIRKNYFGFIPFRSPHHTSSGTAMLGGGQNMRPGEVTLAHNGVLFLDELPEFDRDVIEGLREPMQSGFISISRSRGASVYPARFIFIGAMNPCPCGKFSADIRADGRFYSEAETCACTANEIRKYRKKISGPILDRIDLKVFIPKLKQENINRIYESGGMGRSAQNSQNAQRSESAKIKEQVCGARERLKFAEEKEKSGKTPFVIKDEVKDILRAAAVKFDLSGRGAKSIINVSKTIACLDFSDEICGNHVAEALQYRKN